MDVFLDEQIPSLPLGHVLIVDDEPHIAAVIAHKFGDAGIAVSMCRNGAEALEAMRRCTPGLVITDWNMPAMGGEALCRAMLADPRLARVPVVVITGLPPGAGRRELLLANVRAVIAKPFSPRDLLERALSVMIEHGAQGVPDMREPRAGPRRRAA